MRLLPLKRTASPVSVHVSGSPHDVGAVLRAYGEELAAAGAAQAGGTFTDLAPADELIKHSPEAFLLGVLFTQGIPAERAWAGPYLLGERLGTLDLEYLAASATEVARAVAEPPALHRFIHTLPRWIVSAASRVSAEYSGSATSIWPDGTHVLEVVRRLRAFDGIGEKKAAMAVEILVRHFGVALNGIECGSVAYDVQVRRVFLRSGLVIADTPQQVRDAACRIAPDSPGTLDLAAWLIGRETCRPRQPVCEECRLGGVCPRLTDLDVEGVGSRRAQPSGRNSSPDSSLG